VCGKFRKCSEPEITFSVIELLQISCSDLPDPGIGNILKFSGYEFFTFGNGIGSSVIFQLFF
jgi:hypothetical protein